MICFLVCLSCSESTSFENPNYTGKPPVTNDDVSEGDEKSIIGEWNLVDLVYESKTEFQFNGQTIATTTEGVASNIDAKIVLDASNDFSQTGSYDLALTITTNGVVSEIPASVTDFTNSGTWEFDESVLIIDTGFGVNEAEILEFTNNKLKFKSVDIESEDGFVTTTTTIQTYEKIVVDSGEGEGEGEGDLDDNEKRIIGEWNLVSLVSENKLESQFNGLTLVTTTDGIASNIDAKLIIDTSKNFSQTGSYDLALTVTSNGMSFDFPSSETSFIDSGTWEFDGSFFELSAVFDVVAAEILELTDDKLKLKKTVVLDLGEAGKETTITIETYQKK